MRSLQLGVLLCAQGQPYAAGTSDGHVLFEAAEVFVGAVLSPALMHFENLGCVGKGELFTQRCFAVFFEKADYVAVTVHVVHQHAMVRWFAWLVHRLHKARHR